MRRAFSHTNSSSDGIVWLIIFCGTLPWSFVILILALPFLILYLIFRDPETTNTTFTPYTEPTGQEKNSMINWDVEDLDALIVDKIVDRAITLGIYEEKVAASMDIVATHLNGCPLRLKELLKADDLNFIHDVAGIRKYLDRTTGELTKCFLLRYTKGKG